MESDVISLLRPRRSILVTGMPRSGTTWLARLLATGRGTALAGREPMNPRGRQYALAGTLPGWARIETPTSRQRRALRSSYAGLNPLVYSRYGRRQWSAPMPWTRLIVKDPFAMLSVPTIVDVTGATPVLLFRHPGAALASYRRMGWAPDLEELQPLVRTHQQQRPAPEPMAQDLPRPGEVAEAEAMGRFWAALYAMALSDLEQVPQMVVVSHEELASGGPAAGQRLFDSLGLAWTERSTAELAGGERGTPVTEASTRAGLHDFNRNPSSVARSWRKHVSEEEVDAIESVTADVRARLDGARLSLSAPAL